VSGGLAQQRGKLTQRAKAETAKNSRNCRESLRKGQKSELPGQPELPKQPGKLMQRAEAGTVENSRNYREFLELPEQLGKLTQRTEDGTVGNSQNYRELSEQPGKPTQRAEAKTVVLGYGMFYA